MRDNSLLVRIVKIIAIVTLHCIKKHIFFLEKVIFELRLFMSINKEIIYGKIYEMRTSCPEGAKTIKIF